MIEAAFEKTCEYNRDASYQVQSLSTVLDDLNDSEFSGSTIREVSRSFVHGAAEPSGLSEPCRKLLGAGLVGLACI
jgi:hypothetical protein